MAPPPESGPSSGRSRILSGSWWMTRRTRRTAPATGRLSGSLSPAQILSSGVRSPPSPARNCIPGTSSNALASTGSVTRPGSAATSRSPAPYGCATTFSAGRTVPLTSSRSGACWTPASTPPPSPEGTRSIPRTYSTRSTFPSTATPSVSTLTRGWPPT